jgi:deoxyinosine 3'endonuclease (endonuclease V)
METGGRAFVAVDVHYLGSGDARAAAVVATDARFCEVVAERPEVVAEALPYRPGELYLRELPPIRAVLSGLGLLVVDGYADLNPGGRPGLGAHAHAEFGIPVIGMAKTAFHTATHAVPVLRGTSPQDQSEWQIEWQTALVRARLARVRARLCSCFGRSAGLPGAAHLQSDTW